MNYNTVLIIVKILRIICCLNRRYINNKTCEPNIFMNSRLKWNKTCIPKLQPLKKFAVRHISDILNTVKKLLTD